MPKRSKGDAVARGVQVGRRTALHSMPSYRASLLAISDAQPEMGPASESDEDPDNVEAVETGFDAAPAELDYVEPSECDTDAEEEELFFEHLEDAVVIEDEDDDDDALLGPNDKSEYHRWGRPSVRE